MESSGRHPSNCFCGAPSEPNLVSQRGGGAQNPRAISLGAADTGDSLYELGAPLLPRTGAPVPERRRPFGDPASTTPASCHRSPAAPYHRGRDLACYCPLDEPCHADVLLATDKQDHYDGASPANRQIVGETGSAAMPASIASRAAWSGPTKGPAAGTIASDPRKTSSMAPGAGGR